MPWIPLYLTPADLPALLDLLGDDIAFVVSNGPGKWRAVASHTPAPRSRTVLWHVPSGPLPLLGAITPGAIPPVAPDTLIEDPWSGWTENYPGAMPDEPYFGPAHFGIIILYLNLQPKDTGSRCGMSSFGWTGNRSGSTAIQPSRVTERRWAKLRRQVAKIGTKVPRGGLTSAEPPEIWAFPDAMQDIDVADRNPL
ncbi:hypothetical protein [Vannielia sp. SX4]|uniref:hypothetical protein n=1 Tax=Vannielia sp. SX4 TaxID=3463852 RepID=UPI0040593077